MKVLFLTNNEVTRPLSEWLASQGEEVICSGEKVTLSDVFARKIEFIISYNYLSLIPPEVISLLPHKVINLHISYLPWNRGVSPNIFSFLEGTPTGITIHEINPELDKGDILLQERIFFDYSIETLKTSYEKSHSAIQALFCQNWEKIKGNLLLARKQVGEGSYHRYSDLEPYREILDYDDLIDVFLMKAAPVYRGKMESLYDSKR